MFAYVPLDGKWNKFISLSFSLSLSFFFLSFFLFFFFFFLFYWEKVSVTFGEISSSEVEPCHCKCTDIACHIRSIVHFDHETWLLKYIQREVITQLSLLTKELIVNLSNSLPSLGGELHKREGIMNNIQSLVQQLHFISCLKQSKKIYIIDQASYVCT